MTVDFDQKYENWLKAVPYYWSPGETLNDCRRFYITNVKDCAIFDSDNMITDPEWVEREISLQRINPNETFCIIPGMSGTDRNMHLRYCKGETLDKLAEVRIQGKATPDWKPTGIKDNTVTVVGASKQIQILLYPWQFGDYTSVKNGI